MLTLPDLYCRMHASTKAVTVGLGFWLIGVAIFFQDISVISRLFGTMFFIVITAPIAAHLLGKAMLTQGYHYWSLPKDKIN